jgi:hypothetical protein
MPIKMAVEEVMKVIDAAIKQRAMSKNDTLDFLEEIEVELCDRIETLIKEGVVPRR